MTISNDYIRWLVQRHRNETLPILQRLWDYYRNPIDFDPDPASRPHTTAQEQGLPRRLTRPEAGSPREIVIENDIAWRVHTMVDFMVGKPPTIESLAHDPARKALIERALHATLEANGGITFYQDLALLGAVYGYVDILVRPLLASSQTDSSSTGTSGTAPSNPPSAERLVHAASQIALETVEAPRAVPVLDESDYRRLEAYALHYTRPLNRLDHENSFLSRLLHSRGRQATVDVTEIITPDSLITWHNNEHVTTTPNLLGVVPVVHIQNLPQPLCYEGWSEVEPLIGLQDELNTRLSDRANRVTLQSFKMYLAKGIEGFTQHPVGPGQMWTTENAAASIETFGGDAAGGNPSEDAHINEIREAMDKASGVSGLAAGVLRNKVGNLTSENALRVTLMGLLAKTQRKRVAYGRGIEQACALVLHALHVAGVLHTTDAERRVCLHWPSPLPENTDQRLKEAQMKLALGVPRERVLMELGYCEMNQHEVHEGHEEHEGRTRT